MAKGIDYEHLALYLRVLGVANRIQLLRKLQVPHAISDIDLPASRKSPTGTLDRRISRQAVSEHLRSLEAIGLLQSRLVDRDGRNVTEYTLNHARLFVVADELRRISLMRPSIMTETATPSMTATGLPLSLPAGPALVLATGPMEGAIYPLQGPGPWAIGRDRMASVSLPYDPFVSKQNSLVERAAGSLFLSNVTTAGNGTRLNWRRLRDGERVHLAGGDAVGVGRSLLFVRGA